MGVGLLILGLLLLVAGGEFLVRGAVGIARNMNISPLVIGMTVVSFGTSAPELLVSLQAATEYVPAVVENGTVIKEAVNGSPEIAIGNVIGSNIANLALVLGLTVLIFPIVIDRQTKIIDWPMMMFATVLFYLVLLDGFVDYWEGLILFSLLLGFTIWLIRNSRKKNTLEVSGHTDKDATILSTFYLLLGLVGLYFGSGWFVDGAVVIAEDFGMSKAVIGVTVVAFGTSAPELVASCVAAYRKQTDISVGNLIGSNIFNIMAVIGITSIVHPIKIKDVDANQLMGYDIYWVIGVALLMIPVLYLGSKVGRLKGVVLLGSYITYISILVLTIKG